MATNAAADVRAASTAAKAAAAATSTATIRNGDERRTADITPGRVTTQVLYTSGGSLSCFFLCVCVQDELSRVL